MGGFLDGRQDCETTQCPLYTWQPYRKLDPDLGWMDTGLHLNANKAAYRRVREEKLSQRREIGEDASKPKRKPLKKISVKKS